MLIFYRLSQDTTALDPLPLKELSLDEVSALLNNCGYSNLIAPFNNYGVHGRILDVLDSIDELKEIDISIKSAKAKAFLTQLREWKTDGVPRAKLEAREMPVKVLSTSNWGIQLCCAFLIPIITATCRSLLVAHPSCRHRIDIQIS